IEKQWSYSSTNKYCSNNCQRDLEHKNRITEWKTTGKIGDRTLKRVLLEINNSCWICGITEWNNKPITFELEHKDGDSTNNSEDNVCLICPNCHSQTETYKAKNKGSGRHYRMKRYYDGKSF
ncbi:HNH endonuclease signature motif containing protein, partial [Arthrospira platensis SPKY1]|nr:HNH endonuclease signature motif containing protein [Arthrospira platensis SPKY1]